MVEYVGIFKLNKPFLQQVLFGHGVLNSSKRKHTILCEYTMKDNSLQLVAIQMIPRGCEGDLAATSVTPLIARVDSADLAG